MSYSSKDIKKIVAKRAKNTNKINNSEINYYKRSFISLSYIVGISALLLPFTYMFIKGIVILNSIPK